MNPTEKPEGSWKQTLARSGKSNTGYGCPRTLFVCISKHPQAHLRHVHFDWSIVVARPDRDWEGFFHHSIVEKYVEARNKLAITLHYRGLELDTVGNDPDQGMLTLISLQHVFRVLDEDRLKVQIKNSPLPLDDTPDPDYSKWWVKSILESLVKTGVVEELPEFNNPPTAASENILRSYQYPDDLNWPDLEDTGGAYASPFEGAVDETSGERIWRRIETIGSYYTERKLQDTHYKYGSHGKARTHPLHRLVEVPCWLLRVGPMEPRPVKVEGENDSDRFPKPGLMGRVSHSVLGIPERLLRGRTTKF